ncbi:hypothetical protein PORY_002334 [Pneumocystis oryctolagi]|uniref:Uncharacterized protein n=1 Tax=Pneumocystis oryctolagi TaxID=42067 RepID=A0ACB7C9H8_9ASCO|nr:hypothetical protein PORY_002334 [Pneumocystis oryctolagi]
MGFGILYYIFRYLSKVILWMFYKPIIVIQHDKIDFKKPIIVFCTHTNMESMIDIAVLASIFPKPVHFWAKNSIFKVNPIASKILYNMGVIPVDRETKNNSMLFKITFNALENVETLAIYPEGTSHTSPHLLNLKDGVSWVALQYKYNMFNYNTSLSQIPDKLNDLILLPVGITYLEKFKYRSNIIVTYGMPIDIGLYKDEFLEDPKDSVKKLTDLMKEKLWKITINATDWDVLRISELSRCILFGDNKNMSAENYILITQSFINMFELHRSNEKRKDILELYNILGNESKALKLACIEVNDIINLHTVSRRYFLLQIVLKTISLITHFPFVLPIIIIHIPTYIMCSFVEKKQIFDESKAQDKLLTAFFVSIIVNICVFFFIKKIIISCPLNGIISISIIIIMTNYYNKVIDGFYDEWKHYKKAWYLGWFILRPHGRNYILQRLYKLQNAKKKLLNIIQSGQGKDINVIKEAFETISIKHFHAK